MFELAAVLVGLLVGVVHSAPHIIFIVADDLGWNDVGWHNPNVLTPHLNMLAQSGIILNRSYVQPLCSPSRAAFLTGMYPFHTGLQHDVIYSRQPKGVETQFQMLPQLLRQHANYATHIVGKWHLGFCSWDYTPTRRGFDTFLGYYSGRLDYYSHSRTFDNIGGYDFRDNEDVSYRYNGTYSAYAFAQRATQIVRTHDLSKPLFLYLAFQNVHNPLQVPAQYSDLYRHVDDLDRRNYSGMVTVMDEAIGNLTNALAARDMLDDTIIIFTTDNGGDTGHGASNFPLRGEKSTLWEGGTRGVAFVSGSRRYLPRSKYTNNHLIHAVDWFPTILDLARVNPSRVLNYKLDGMSQLNALTSNVAVRSRFVYNIDEVDGVSAIRAGNYKLIVGNPYSQHINGSAALRERGSAVKWSSKHLKLRDLKLPINQVRSLDPDVELLLFDVEHDPHETKEIGARNPKVVAALLRELTLYAKSLVPDPALPPSQRAHPMFWGDVWSPGWCEKEQKERFCTLPCQLDWNTSWFIIWLIIMIFAIIMTRWTMLKRYRISNSHYSLIFHK